MTDNSETKQKLRARLTELREKIVELQTREFRALQEAAVRMETHAEWVERHIKTAVDARRLEAFRYEYDDLMKHLVSLELAS